MMHTFRLVDVLRCLLLNASSGPNLACTRQGLNGASTLSNSRLWEESLAQRRHRVNEVLVAQTVDQGGRQSWLVPDYQKEIPGLLLKRRFKEVARYCMMIKTVAVPVLSHGMAPVEA